MHATRDRATPACPPPGSAPEAARCIASATFPIASATSSIAAAASRIASAASRAAGSLAALAIAAALSACGGGSGGAPAAADGSGADVAQAGLAVPKAISATPASAARWSTLQPLPLVPVSVANLPDGKLLLWSAESRTNFNTGRGKTYMATWDPATGTATERLVSETGHDMFCPGTSNLADGRLLVNGGIDAANTSLYDPVAGTWTRGPAMNITRGYNANATLSDGSVLTLGGSWSGGSGNKHGEVWTPAGGATGSWRRVDNLRIEPFLASGGSWGGDAHLWLVPAGNGRVLHAGPVAQMHWLDTDGAGSITPIGPRGDDQDSVTGSLVMYDAGKLLKTGGTTFYNGDNKSTTGAYVIDTNGGVTTRKIAPMAYGRTFHNSVVLPSGQVIVIGGQTFAKGFSNDYGVMRPELFDPVTETWTLLPEQAAARNYHSVAILLPDARVVSAGGGLCGGCNNGADHQDLQVLSPPYLFNADGTPAARPAITAAPTTVHHGSKVRVTTDRAIASFAMVRMSSTTHTVNNDQRRLPVGFRSVGTNTWELDVPSNPGLLLPGYWMLFAMDAQGTPSVARTVLVSNAVMPRLRTPDTQTVAVGGWTAIRPQAADPGGTVLTWSAAGLPAGLSIDPLSGAISGTPTVAGRHVVTLTVTNGVSTVSSWFVLNVVNLGATRYVALQALSEVNGNPWTSVAELEVLDADGQPIARTGWQAGADSQENATTGAAMNAIDGNPATVWHTQFTGANPPPPHTLTVDLGRPHAVSGVRILPRQDGNTNGIIARYRVLTSTDGATWSVMAEGNLADFGAPALQKTVSLYNLALRRPAVLSSEAFGGVAARAVDGNRDGNWAGNSVAHSDTQAQPWLQVDLGDRYPLHAVQVWNRTDCCGDRLKDFIVFVSDTDMRGRTTAQLMADPAVWRSQFAGVPGRSARVAAPVHGRFVRLQSTLTNYLNVAELEVLGWPVANVAPVLGSLPTPTLIRGSAATIPLAATDADGDALSWTAANLPAGLTIDPQRGTIAGTPTAAGFHAATVTVTDARGASASGTVAFTIIETQVTIDPVTVTPVADGQTVRLSAAARGSGALTYSWNFGDGSAPTAFASTADATHRYAAPGVYAVTLTARDAYGTTSTRTFQQVVFAAATAGAPRASSPLAVEKTASGDRIWVANPDTDTVSVIDAASARRIAEIPVGASPRTLAIAGDGRVWVLSKQAPSLSVLDPVALRVVATHALPRGSQPHGIAFGSDGNAYVTLEALGQLARIDATGAVRASVAVGGDARHLAITADGARILVSRFITPPLPGESGTTITPTAATGGEVVIVRSDTLAVTGRVVLAHSERADTSTQARGIPNYLGAAAISPDGRSAWVPSKQDNVKRGPRRDGLPLDFQNTVRAISSRIDLGTLTEDLAGRVDHDNSSVATAAVFHPTGAYLFVALETSREIAVMDATGKRELFRVPAGRAPQGLAMSSDGLTLYVSNFMDRSVGLHDLTPLVRNGELRAPERAVVGAIGSEKLSPQVLAGKQLFYDARDPRLARDRYMSCASCHADGGQDGRVWDLSHAGEGLRNTASLRGRAGAQGLLHWSANFDEVQDFEGQIRTLAGGTGLMTDAQFAAGTRSQPLGDRKTGVSADLDALAAYVASLNRFDPSPLRAADGTLTADAVAGSNVFRAMNCAGCHGGAAFTLSGTLAPQDVGTIRPASGQRLGGALTGIDVPTLRDVWATAPYLHDGSAATLGAAVRAHKNTTITDADLGKLVAFLQQIGGDEADATSAGEVAGLRGDYWAASRPGNGPPALTRYETVDFDWGIDPPAPQIPSLPYSARWNGWLVPPVSGSYKLQTLSDDGVRVWLDGQLVIDNWTDHGATVDTSAALTLTAGKRHAIRVDYYNMWWDGVMRLRWIAPGTTTATAVPLTALRSNAAAGVGGGAGGGLKGEYFNALEPGTSPVVLTRTEAVDFDWGSDPPAPGIARQFSVRWTGTFTAPAAGSYRLRTISDDGVRLWVDGQLVIDNWTPHAPAADTTGTIVLAAGQSVTLRMEYNQWWGGAVARLQWLPPGASVFDAMPAAVLKP